MSVFLVRDLMSREVATLRENEQLTIADDVMRLGRVRHLPVVDDEDRLVGIVSQRDLFRGALARTLGYGEVAQSRLLATIRVKDVMSTDVATVTPDTGVNEAARRLVEQKIGCLVVTDGDAIEGILTEADFVKLMMEPS
jgi:CBS domain-containing membrane protein